MRMETSPGSPPSVKARSNLLTKAQTSYTYDLLGNVTNILAADGTTTEYEYNADGEVVSELVRNIAYSGEADEENHYSTLANTSSKPFVATAIRYTEDAINANKGSGFAKPMPKTPSAAKPKTLAQEYVQAMSCLVSSKTPASWAYLSRTRSKMQSSCCGRKTKKRTKNRGMCCASPGFLCINYQPD